jgi:PAS domain S-box-containing protein
VSPIADPENRKRNTAAGQAPDACHGLTERELTRLAAIFHYSNDAILSTDLNSNIDSWNPAAATIYGYEAEEVIGKNISILAPPGYAGEVADIVRRIRGGERIEHFKTKSRRKDGRPIDVSLTVSPIMDADGRISGASTIARDITKEEHAGDELRKWAHFFQRAEWGVVVGRADSRTLDIRRTS